MINRGLRALGLKGERMVKPSGKESPSKWMTYLHPEEAKELYLDAKKRGWSISKMIRHIIKKNYGII